MLAVLVRLLSRQKRIENAFRIGKINFHATAFFLP